MERFNRIQVINTWKTLRDVQKYSAEQLSNITDNFEETYVRHLLITLTSDCDPDDTERIIYLQREALDYLRSVWKEVNTAPDHRMHGYFADYEIYFLSGLPVSVLTDEELAELCDETFKRRLVTLLLDYIDHTRGKECTTRRYIRTVVQDLLQMADVQLTSEHQQQLDASDDQLIKELHLMLDKAEKDIAQRLMPVFFNKLDPALDFVHSIKGADAQQITTEVNKLLRQGVVSPQMCHHAMWVILHETRYYLPNISNWNKYISVPKPSSGRSSGL